MKRKVLFKIFILFISLFFGIEVVQAATYTASIGSKSITKGNTTKLTIKGNGVTGRFNIKSSNSSVISISEDRAWIENDSYTITLSALGIGTSTITITPSNVSDENGNSINLDAKTFTITVNTPREKSSNNDLKSLSVEGYEISPEFNKNVKEYSVTVPSTVDKINIVAKKSDSYSSLDGTGEKSVEEGVNTFEIVVTSETGVSNTYKLTVNVEDQNPIEVVVDGVKYTVVKVAKNLEKPELFDETTIKIGEYDIPAFHNEVSKYTLVGLKDESGNIGLFIYNNGEYTKYNAFVSDKLSIIFLELEKVPTNYKKTTVSINEQKVSAYRVSGDDRLLVYGVNLATGKKNYYTYDKDEKTLQIFDINSYEKGIKDSKNNQYMIYGLSILCVLLFILMILFMIKSSKLKKIVNLKGDK